MSHDPRFASTIRNLGHSAMEHPPARVLREEELPADPLGLFESWLREAVERGVRQPLGMTLATVDTEGRAAARIVLLRGVGPSGFEFHTNYESAKARQVAGNPNAALVFWWSELERQVRIEGAVRRAPAEVSDAYWLERPRASRLAALASNQSAVISGRAQLDERVKALEAEYAGREIPRPANWGGFFLMPARYEFWQEGPNRLHDRFEYARTGADGWTRRRLSP